MERYRAAGIGFEPKRDSAGRVSDGYILKPVCRQKVQPERGPGDRSDGADDRMAISQPLSQKPNTIAITRAVAAKDVHRYDPGCYPVF